MVALQTDELKEFTRQLFIGDTFDHFLVREVKIVTFNSPAIIPAMRHRFAGWRTFLRGAPFARSASH